MCAFLYIRVYIAVAHEIIVLVRAAGIVGVFNVARVLRVVSVVCLAVAVCDVGVALVGFLVVVTW